MKWGVVIFPGSNCDRDVIYVLEKVLNQEVRVLWHADTSLDDFEPGDWIILPGGFTFGDYLRPGIIASFSSIMESIREFVERGGYVLGICNGFQILCEAGLLPGALVKNDHGQFVCKHQFIIPVNRDTPLTRFIDESVPLNIPIAHSDGRYFIDEQGLKDLLNNQQIVFQYCNEKGVPDDESNPNGSLLNIAGICDRTRRVFGMMPHPERNADPVLTGDSSPDGLKIFKSIVRWSREHC